MVRFDAWNRMRILLWQCQLLWQPQPLSNKINQNVCALNYSNLFRMLHILTPHFPNTHIHVEHLRFQKKKSTTTTCKWMQWVWQRRKNEKPFWIGIWPSCTVLRINHRTTKLELKSNKCAFQDIFGKSNFNAQTFYSTSIKFLYIKLKVKLHRFANMLIQKFGGNFIPSDSISTHDWNKLHL